MQRTQIYLSDKEQESLKKEAEDLDISKSELIRRILDNHIHDKKIRGSNSDG